MRVRLLAVIFVFALFASCRNPWFQFQPDDGGTVRVDLPAYAVTVIGGTGSGNYSQGASVTITADTPPEGQQFKNWTTASAGVTFANAANASTTFAMPGNAVIVTANFEAIPIGNYLITVNINGNGTANADVQSAAAGATITLNATPNSGYTFVNWTTASEGVTLANPNNASTTFTMPPNAVTVTAHFEQITYLVTVNNGAGSGNYAEGDTVTITANAPPEGQQFANWTTTSAGVTFASADNASTTFAMPPNAVTVTANFEDIPIGNNLITVTNNGNGTANADVQSAPQGETVTLTATPNSGYRFVGWQVVSGGVTLSSATSATATFTMPDNAVTVTANFEQITYAVTVTGGTGSGNYAEGASVTITADTPPEGQQFANWTTTSAGVTFANADSATTTFAMPPNAVTVTANFEQITYAVTVTNGTGGGNFAQGATVTITANTPLTGQQFKNWTTTSAGVTFADADSATTTFIMPPNAVTVTASVEQIFTPPSQAGLYFNTDLVSWTDGNRVLSVNPNDVEAAFDYVNSNTLADGYTLFIDSATPISTTWQTLDSDSHLTIHGLGDSATTIQLNGTGTLFAVSSDATLTLGNNVTLKGNTGNTEPLVYADGGTFIMTGGAIRGNKAPDGGGVFVSNGGTFIMDGGEISGNTASDRTNSQGGGVWVGPNSTFTMTGGEISGNTAPNGGGVYVTGADAEFTMNGGTISGNESTINTAASSGGGGGGVYVDGATFTMNYGTISGNKTTVANNTGGGGGGVFVNSGTFTMNDGEISGGTVSGGNNSTQGGGVFVRTGAFDMNGGTIWGNTVGYDGGGVFVYQGATFTMTGGTISGNKAGTASTGRFGGGVYVGNNNTAIFRIVTGTIYGTNESDTALQNTSTGTGGTAALCKFSSATTQYGTFNGSTWNGTNFVTIGTGTATGISDTIKVLNGEIVP